jgi:hypothetical protein
MRTDQRSTFAGLLAAALSIAALPSVAHGDALARAEAAYNRIEFFDTERFAKAALIEGNHGPAALIRIYFLLGVSAAANQHDEEAIDAYRHLLTLDPQTKLDRGLSPKLQGPMLEARGTPPGALACAAAFDPSRGVLRFTVHDPLAMSRELVIRSRLSPTGAFSESRVRVGTTFDVSIPGATNATHFEYSYRLLDAHRNRLIEKGSDAAPETIHVVAGAPAASASAPIVVAERRSRSTVWLAVGVVGELLGVAALAGGLGGYFVGKSAAERWNDDSICLANGRSRTENCASDRTIAETAGRGAIAGLTIGGALMVASTIILIAAPRTRPERATRLEYAAGPGLVGVSFGGRF